MRSITISVSYSFLLRTKENISATSPLPHWPSSLAFLGSFCALYLSFSQRLDVCSVLWNQMVWEQTELQHLCCLTGTLKYSNRYLFVMLLILAVYNCNPYIIFDYLGKQNTWEIAMDWFLTTTKTSNFPTDYLCFKKERRKIVDVRVGMIISGRIIEWNSSLSVRGIKGACYYFWWSS